MAFISPSGLKQLKAYKYQSSEYSIGDKLLTPYWNYCVTLLPLVSFIARSKPEISGWRPILSPSSV